jgi:hypothetical protein
VVDVQGLAVELEGEERVAIVDETLRQIGAPVSAALFDRLDGDLDILGRAGLTGARLLVTAAQPP